jgi:hypothetical protein
MPQSDLFGQPAGGYINTSRPMMKIPGNEILERWCGKLLDMIRERPELLDGDTVGEVDENIFIAVAWETVFKDVVAPERRKIFEDAMRKVPPQEILGRARRELQARDYIRLSSRAVKSGEQFRSRIAGAMRNE